MSTGINRGWIIVAIVLGVTAVAGGATYYFTDKYGSADPLIESLIPAGISAPGSPAIAGPPPPDLPPPPGPGAVQGASAATQDFDALMASFDHKTNHLVWVLPPGIHAEGPFVAKVTITSNGNVQHESEFPLVASNPASGARAEFPAGSDVLRLSLDDTWPAKRDQLRGLVQQVKASKGSGELEIKSDFKTKIDPERKREYCMQSDKIAIDLYIEDGAKALKKVDISEALPILQRTIVTGGCIG